MTALSDQFVILDKLRAGAEIAPDAWCRKAGVLWMRYLKFKTGTPFEKHETPFPTEAELRALERALQSPSNIRTADDAISPRHPAALSFPQPSTPAARPESISSRRVRA